MCPRGTKQRWGIEQWCERVVGGEAKLKWAGWEKLSGGGKRAKVIDLLQGDAADELYEKFELADFVFWCWWNSKKVSLRYVLVIQWKFHFVMMFQWNYQTKSLKFHPKPLPSDVIPPSPSSHSIRSKTATSSTSLTHKPTRARACGCFIQIKRHTTRHMKNKVNFH